MILLYCSFLNCLRNKFFYNCYSACADEAKGTDGLIDRRGKAKLESDLTEADKLRMENKILQAKIRDREMEIAILKNSGN